MRKHIMLCILVAVAAGSVSAASPQTRSRRPYTKSQVNDYIRRVERRSDEWVKIFDHALDRSVLDDSNREDRLNERARELERAMDRLRAEFDVKENYRDTRPEATGVLAVARGINTVMRRKRFGRYAERAWTNFRSELNGLAWVYDLPRLP